MKRPDLNQLRRDEILAKNQLKVAQLGDSFLKEVADVRSFVDEVRQHVRRIQALPRGMRGERGPAGKDGVGKDGKDGYTPVKGEDYFDGKTPVRGKDYWTDRDIDFIILAVLSRIRQPKDGEDAVVDEEALARKTAEYILEKELLEVKHVKGLRNEVDSYRNQLAMKQAGQHGGGTTVSAGNNITLTPLPNGTTRIDASGGSANLATEPVVAVQSGTDVTIDLTQLSNPYTSIQFVSLNGQIINTTRWSVLADVMTVTDGFDTDEFQIQYVYA